jgi:hypothetical protein
VKQGVRLGVTVGLILGGTLLHKYVLLPLTLSQQEERAVPQVLGLSSPVALPIVSASATTATVSGVTVQVDPRTGRLRPPTNQQKRALATAFRQQFSQPSPHAAFSYGSGMLSIVVGQSQLNFSVAHVTPKGEVKVSCLTGVEETATLLENGIPLPLASSLPVEE